MATAIAVPIVGWWSLLVGLAAAVALDFLLEPAEPADPPRGYPDDA